MESLPPTKKQQAFGHVYEWIGELSGWQ